jgi:hypothetical protein
MPRVEYEKLSDDRLREESAVVQARVETPREKQRQRFSESTSQRGQISKPDHLQCRDATR